MEDRKRGNSMDRRRSTQQVHRRAVEVLAVTVEGDLEALQQTSAPTASLVELVMALEEAFDIEVAEDELKDIRTVGEASN